MGCDCYTVGGGFVGADPDCPAHGTEAQYAEDCRAREIENSNEEKDQLQATITQLTTKLNEYCWVSGKLDTRPPVGSLIVKRWKSGAVWAGIYSGGPKDTMGDEWIVLP